MGRTWSDEEKAKACEEILKGIAGGKSLSAVCDHGDDWIPPRKTFEGWCDADPQLAADYARARDERAEAIFEECLIIADSQEGDVIEVDGREVPNHDLIQRAKLRIDTRKWMLGKMQPKKYGDKLAIGGADDLPPIQTEEVSPLERINRRLAGIAARTGSAGDPAEPDAS